MLVEIESDQSWDIPRRVYYRVTLDTGEVITYGPVFTSDPNFDAEAYKTVIENEIMQVQP